MTDNPHPKWKQERCEWCAKGMPMALDDSHHWTGNRNPPRCTAPTPEQYIVELEQESHLASEKAINAFADASEIPVLKKRIAKLEAKLAEFKSKRSTCRYWPDAAMSQTAKEQKLQTFDEGYLVYICRNCGQDYSEHGPLDRACGTAKESNSVL